MTTLRDWLAENPERRLVFAQEQLIVSVAESIWCLMDGRRVTKSDVAKTLGKSKAYVTQVLNGTRNMTLRTLADIASALDARVSIELHPNEAAADWSVSHITKQAADVVSESSLSNSAADAADAKFAGTYELRYQEAA